MYLYFPDRRYGTDKVALVHGLQAAAGDLLEVEGTYAIVLGEEISFRELIQAKALSKDVTVVLHQVLTSTTLQLIHRFVDHRFCTYANAVPLRIGDIPQLIRQHKKSKKSMGRTRSIHVQDDKLQLQKTEETMHQQLVVFPDLRTMTQTLPDRIVDQEGVIQLHSGLTVVQKAKAFRGIKSGVYHTILSTHAELFQDFVDLKSIILVDQHKRRYKSQQDPRYRTPTVITQLAASRQAHLSTTGYALVA